jgi:DNA repair protein RecO (recombination protein O)
LGYGLSLDTCVVTGKKDNLYYVSPKSGMAVSKYVGQSYHDKLFILPQFYSTREKAKMQDIDNAFKLNEYFINKFLYHPKSQTISAIRQNFYSLISNNSCTL